MSQSQEDAVEEYMSQPKQTKRLRRFVNGKKYVLFSELAPEVRAAVLAREEREKQEGLWWEEADKEASLAELRFLRSRVPGEYKWTREGWVLLTGPAALVRQPRFRGHPQ
jgi:hypothetical protein